MIYGTDSQVDIIFLKKGDVKKLLRSSKISGDFDDIIMETKNSIDKLYSIKDIKPLLRKNEATAKAAQTMFGFGESKRFRDEYVGSKNYPKSFSGLQPMINVLEFIFKKVGDQFIFVPDQQKSKDKKMAKLFDKSYLKKYKDSALDLELFNHGVYSLDYWASTHLDIDKSFTLVAGIWPFPGSGGQIYFPECGFYFIMKDGDILIFNGRKKHGSVAPKNISETSHKMTVALFN